jgi:hypothetical protein
VVKGLVSWVASGVVTCASLAVIAGGPSVPAAASAPVVAGGTYIPAPGRHHVHAARGAIDQSSTNWSGYVQSAFHRHTFTAVTDTFVVPTVTSSLAGTQYAADWVGIGGFTDRTLVQDGIQAVVTTANNQTTVAYDAWTEILPHAEKPLKLQISAGDIITAAVQETATNRWVMSVDDVTTGQTLSRHVRYRSSGLSAEAIHERPCIATPCSSHLAALAQTAGVTFEPGFFSEAPVGFAPVYAGLLGSASGAVLNSVTMEIDNGNQEVTVLATPSAANDAQDGFTVGDGNVAPPPPTV